MRDELSLVSRQSFYLMLATTLFLSSQAEPGGCGIGVARLCGVIIERFQKLVHSPLASFVLLVMDKGQYLETIYDLQSPLFTLS